MLGRKSRDSHEPIKPPHLVDSGRPALYDFPFFTDVDDTRADTSAKLPQFRDSFLVAIFTPPPDNHIGAGAGEPASKTQADRKSVVEGKSVSVRVDLGGRRIIQKKKYVQIRITTYIL